MDIIDSLEILLEHPLLHSFRTDLMGAFWDPTSSTFKRFYPDSDAGDARTRLVNVARVAQTANVLPMWADLQKLAQDQLKATLDSAKEGELYNIFKEEGLLSAAYSTSKILLATGAETDAVFSADQRRSMSEKLLEALDKLIKEYPDSHPSLVLLIFQALRCIGGVPESVRVSVQLWAERLLYKCQAIILAGKVSSFAPLDMVAAVITLGLTGTDTITARERETAIKMIIDSKVILPDESPRSVVAVERNAIGYSAYDAVIDLLVEDQMSAVLLKYPDFLMSLLKWLDGHNYTMKSGDLLFYTDVFISKRRLELWFNATVHHFLYVLKERILNGRRASILKSLGSRSARDSVSWANLAVGGYKWPDHFTKTVFNDMREQAKKGMPLAKNGIILFGPPGTGKTSIADALALELGCWPVIRIGPELFLQEGRGRVFYWIRKVFDLLEHLTDVVVLFDEFELLVLDRDNNESVGRFAGWETGLITDVMLPRLQDLHDYGRVMYIMATNHIDKIDTAILRDGRFDYKLPVGPPSQPERKTLLGADLQMAGWDTDKLAKIPESRATIGEILSWRALLKKERIPTVAFAKEIWQQRFAPALRLSKRDMIRLAGQIKKYASLG